MNNINLIYEDNISIERAQTICREILSNRISKYEFKNKSVKSICENIVNNISFPIESKTEIEEIEFINNKHRNKCYILGGISICGIISSLLTKEQNSITTIMNIVSVLSGSASGFYYAKSIDKQIRRAIKIVTPKETLIAYIDGLYKKFIQLDNAFSESRTIHNELLIWFQTMYAWACRDLTRNRLKEDINDIMLRFGYEFIDFTQNYADFFDASNANVNEVSTTVPALFSTNKHEVILRGKVVFPIN